MRMTLVGQYDSPYTRRVAVSLGLLGFDFVQDARSVFADFDSMRGHQSARPRAVADPVGWHDADRFSRDPRLARPAGRAGARFAAAGQPGAASGAAAHRARHRHDRQGHGRRLRAFRSTRALPLGRLGRALPNPGRRRPPRAGGTVMAGRCARAPGLDHRRLHDALCAAGRADLLPTGRYPSSTLSPIAARRCPPSRRPGPPTMWSQRRDPETVWGVDEK